MKQDTIVESPPYNAAKALWIVAIVVCVIGIQLYRTAVSTGNFEGMWFSLAHTVLVGAGALCALGWRKRG